MHPEPRTLLRVEIISLGLLLGAALTAPTAHAQPPAQHTEAEVEAARALFAEGLAHSDAAEWEAAAAVFHEVLNVVSTPPVLFNLAHALVELNQFDEAEELIERVLSDSAAARDLRRRSTALLTRMDQHGGRLTVRPTGLPAGASVLLNGRPLAGERLGRSLRVSQGTHRVTITDAPSGAPIGNAEVYVARRARLTLDVAPDPALVDANAVRAAALAAQQAQAAAEAAAAARAATDAELAELQRLHAEWEAERAAGRVPEGENPFQVRRQEIEQQRMLQREEARRAAEAAEQQPHEPVPLRRNWRFWMVVGSVAALAIGVGAAVAATNDREPNRGVLGNFSPGRVEF